MEFKFPVWAVCTRVREGSPSRELLREAEEWGPELIVVGSQGRSALGRFFLGSVSYSLATCALGSVRVGRRGVVKEDGEPVRLAAGVDGSDGARWAVFAVATRARGPRAPRCASSSWTTVAPSQGPAHGRSWRRCLRAATKARPLAGILQPFAALYVLMLASLAPLLAKESERIYDLYTRLLSRVSKAKTTEEEAAEGRV